MNADSAEARRCIWVASDGDTALVRVTGRASFMLGPCVKELGNALIDRNCRQIVFDLVDCESVDSTFLGVLAGVAARMKKNGPGRITLINLSPALYENISMLGLSRIMDCYETGSSSSEFQRGLGSLGSLSLLPVERSNSDSTRRTVIEAHEALIRSDARNIPRFKNVLTFLRESNKDE